jgi:hypothetical protein
MNEKIFRSNPTEIIPNFDFKYSFLNVAKLLEKLSVTTGYNSVKKKLTILQSFFETWLIMTFKKRFFFN